MNLRMLRTQQESQNWELLAEPLGTKELHRLQSPFKIPWQERPHLGDQKPKAPVKEKGLGHQQHAMHTADKLMDISTDQVQDRFRVPKERMLTISTLL